MKPLKLIEKAINNSSKTDDIVMDLFGGSGSTLIACEQTKRVCFMMELDPRYVDVIRKRYAKFIGKENEWQEVTPKIN
jgi:site-specific DNA-methyltransferase (adenine-specific)